MSTSDGSLSPDQDLASQMAREIERVANELFKGAPGLPAAANVGAGGASPAVVAPPIPGPAVSMPIAATPPPRESDLRGIPAQLGTHLGVGPLALVRTPEQAPDVPYFIGLAGMPEPPSPAASPPANPTYATTSVLPAPAPAPPPGLQGQAGAPSGAASGAGAGLPSGAQAFEFDPELVPELGVSPGLFDPNVIKKDFPILSERVHGRPVVWLDNAATTQKPRAVIERVSYFYEHENSNVHRAAHTLAARSTDAYEGARAKVARFLNAPSPKQIVFTRGATEAINLVAQSWGRRNVNAGDEIVITWLEHHANIVPWQQLASEKKARLRVAPVDSTGQIILEEYDKLLNPKTRIVSLSQVSNALGTVTPAREMVEMAHRHGARVLVDGAQAVSHTPVDVQALDPDFYVFSGHKLFAPTGIGALYGKADVLETMPPWQGGGNMIADVTFEKTTYQSAPARFEAGTGSIADAVGLGAAIDYVTALGMNNIEAYERGLRLYAEEQLLCVPGLTIIGTAPEKAGVMSFVLDGVRTEEVGGILDQEGIAVRSGHHCAQPILRRFGLESTVRASLAPYNTREDVDALVAALKRIQVGRPNA